MDTLRAAKMTPLLCKTGTDNNKHLYDLPSKFCNQVLHLQPVVTNLSESAHSEKKQCLLVSQT